MNIDVRWLFLFGFFFFLGKSCADEQPVSEPIQVESEDRHE